MNANQCNQERSKKRPLVSDCAEYNSVHGGEKSNITG